MKGSHLPAAARSPRCRGAGGGGGGASERASDEGAAGGRDVRGGQVQHPAARHQEPGGPGLGAERPAAQVSGGDGEAAAAAPRVGTGSETRGAEAIPRLSGEGPRRSLLLSRQGARRAASLPPFTFPGQGRRRARRRGAGAAGQRELGLSRGSRERKGRLPAGHRLAPGVPRLLGKRWTCR